LLLIRSKHNWYAHRFHLLCNPFRTHNITTQRRRIGTKPPLTLPEHRRFHWRAMMCRSMRTKHYVCYTSDTVNKSMPLTASACSPAIGVTRLLQLYSEDLSTKDDHAYSGKKEQTRLAEDKQRPIRRTITCMNVRNQVRNVRAGSTHLPFRQDIRTQTCTYSK
jgi:hypothetical protein